MNVEQWLGNDAVSELKELLGTVLAEWMSYTARVREKEKPEQAETEIRRIEEWEERVKEICPELAIENRKFLDWMVGCQGEAQEDFYFYGLLDGARAMKWLMEKLEG